MDEERLPTAADTPPAVATERQLLTQLATSVAALSEALTAHERHQRAELAAVRQELADWRRWAAAQEQRVAELGPLLRQAIAPPASAGDPAAPAAAAAWQRWRESRRGLGASLTLTGVVAGVSGVLLHLALRNQVIDTTVHLGYLIGRCGLLLFLVGLLIVF